ncbi:hypothetical protein GOP47_0013005 [Adiantum capillus-veneris]|uniref:FAS1 domain-containing protein n=1 Tax=Adiantum capillus-veneris TaxID=13818 RepID=A0A9D4US72_ADICA|nr:hypothetical protein GOP47_0013005 [Adiantum capillus-veneris]
MAQAWLIMVAIMLLCLAPSYNSLSPSSPSPSPAPVPTPALCNITQVIQSAGQFSSFLQLMSQTAVGEKFQAKANQTHIGITIFAPIDKAFARAPTSTLLKNITQQQKVSLCEYHALPKWYPLASLQQTDNNVTSTYATYNNAEGGKYSFNVTDEDGNVEIKTGWASASIVSTLYNAAPCSIFAIDEVLLPEDIFGLPSLAPAPAPSTGAPLVSPSTEPASSLSGSSRNPGLSTAASGPSSEPSIAPQLPYFQALLFTCLVLCVKISLL